MEGTPTQGQSKLPPPQIQGAGGSVPLEATAPDAEKVAESAGVAANALRQSGATLAGAAAKNPVMDKNVTPDGATQELRERAGSVTDKTGVTPASLTHPSAKVGGYNQLREGGGGIYLNISSVSHARKLPELKRVLDEFVGWPSLYYFDRDSRDKLNASNFLSDAMASLKDDEILVAFGINYLKAMDGVPVLQVIRNQADLDYMNNAGGCNIRGVGKRSLSSIRYCCQSHDFAPK